jgi:hypothetical protein
MRALLARRWVWGVVSLVVLVAVGVGVWLGTRPEAEQERERRYRAETACLLTGADGLRGPLQRHDEWWLLLRDGGV